MKLEKIKIGDIPAIIWGEASDKIIIAAHGSHIALRGSLENL